MSEFPAFKEHELVASICRDSFFDFVKEMWSIIIPEEPVWNWHIEYLCDELQLVAERVFANKPKEYDLIINVSPGSSKSSVCSIMFPAWCWVRMATCRLICASYAYTLAIDLARKSRDVIKSERYRQCFPNVLIREDQDTKGDFVNTRNGDRLSVGVNGAVMGRHAHIIIIDDPLDPNQAHSEAEIRAANHWMIETIPQRKISNEVTPLILIMQRLHHEDPTGAMLERSRKEGAGKVKHICLPIDTFKRGDSSFEVRPPELASRYINGLMDPVRFPLGVVREKEVNLGAYGFAGQYGQSPTPAGGGMFKETYFNQRKAAAPFKAKRIRFWDRAATENAGCRTAGVLMAKCPEGNYYVEHVVLGQWEPDERNARMKAAALRDRAKYGPGNEPEIHVEREGGSAGRDAMKGVARALAGFNVREATVTGKKETRAEPWSAQLAAKNVYLVEDGTWDINEFVSEHCAFPFGKYKDQVDSASGAFNLLAGAKVMSNVLRSMKVESRNRKNPLRIIVCSLEEFEQVDIDKPALLVSFQEPQGQRSYGNALSVIEGKNNAGKIVDTLSLAFAPLDLSECQDVWEQPHEKYGVRPEEVVMNDEMGKKFWSFVTRRREPAPSIIVLQDEGDGRALSVAYAIADTMRIFRKDSVELINSRDNIDEDEAPVPHVYKMTKATRSSVI